MVAPALQFEQAGIFRHVERRQFVVLTIEVGKTFLARQVERRNAAAAAIHGQQLGIARSRNGEGGEVGAVAIQFLYGNIGAKGQAGNRRVRKSHIRICIVGEMERSEFGLLARKILELVR